MISLDLLAAFLMGIAGSGHCISMCGGLAGALGYKASLSQLVSYNSGRIVSYTIAGAIVGALSFGLQIIHLNVLIYLRIVAGIMMLLLALYLLRFQFSLLWLEKLGANLWKLVQPLAGRVRNIQGIKGRFMSGMVWGWLPCGLVYSALTWSATGEYIWESALFMFAFGLGTLPSMLTIGSFAGVLHRVMKSQAFRWTFSMLLAVYGIQTLYIGVLQLT